MLDNEALSRGEKGLAALSMQPDRLACCMKAAQGGDELRVSWFPSTHRVRLCTHSVKHHDRCIGSRTAGSDAAARHCAAHAAVC